MVELLWERLWTHRPIGLCHKAMWNRLISPFVQEAETPARQTGNERTGHEGVADGRIVVGKIMDAQTNRSVPQSDDRGRESRMVTAPPPSKPDWQISRIRLSS